MSKSTPSKVTVLSLYPCFPLINITAASHCNERIKSSITLSESTNHLLPLSNARLLAAIEDPIATNTKHITVPGASDLPDLFPRNVAPILTPIHRTRVDIVTIQAVNIVTSSINLHEWATSTRPRPCTRLLTLIWPVTEGDPPDITTTWGRDMLESSRDIHPPSRSISCPFPDMSPPSHPPHLLITHVQLLEDARDL